VLPFKSKGNNGPDASTRTRCFAAVHEFVVDAVDGSSTGT
jgi:hypothetical protein